MASNVMKTIIQKDGSIVIPSEYLKTLELKPEDEVFLSLKAGEIRIVSTRQAVAWAQALVRRYIPQGRNLSEELIKDRRGKETYEN
jgi:bifunctional DNA-binding transcriptional regulator/antitoxin component of YhaV-PrlF toxin-antitoxin module